VTSCDFDVVLYFYDELHFDGETEARSRADAAAHVRACESCRHRLEDLHAIRRALAERPPVEAPPAGDWSGFMRRLDAAVAPPRFQPHPEARAFSGGSTWRPTGGRWSVRHLVTLAAMLAVVTIGVIVAARYRATAPAPQVAASTAPSVYPAAVAQPASPGTPALAFERDQSLREGSVEHLERSKLVVLGLTTRDPRQTTADDWQYERRLAGSLLSDTRLYRIAAQDRGVSDVARVMRDLETVLLETSLSDSSDRDALQRLQQLIAKRDLVMKMQVVVTSGSAGI